MIYEHPRFMTAAHHLYGRERTAAEFKSLLESTGLQLLHVIPTASPMIPLRMIEASLDTAP
jgi:hypothetical protein